MAECTCKNCSRVNCKMRYEPSRICCSLWYPKSNSAWIPCSERMPDDIKPVLITWANNSPVMSCHENDKGKPFTGAAHYCNGKWYWYSQFSEDILGEYGEYQDTVDVDVLAWMPMPEAYKSPEGGEHDA